MNIEERIKELSYNHSYFNTYVKDSDVRQFAKEVAKAQREQDADIYEYDGINRITITDSPLVTDIPVRQK